MLFEHGWAKEIKKNDAASPTQQLRYEYWTAFMDYAFKNAAFAKEFNRRSPNRDSWMTFSIGSSASTTSNFTAGADEPMRYSFISQRKKPILSSVWLFNHSMAALCSSRARLTIQMIKSVGLDITVAETESAVGGFNVDIFASETGTDRKIIIENQLEDTDHDHLGKLITYA